VINGEIVDMWKAGIVDPLKVVSSALESAVMMAMRALTTDVLVRKAKPHESLKP